jgi:archaellum component FlaC
MKNLIGRADIENALRTLDELTQEEARMAISQVWKATRKIDERLAGVDERVGSIDGRVARVDERVISVDEGVTSVGESVANIDERLAGIDERLAVVDETVRAIDDRVAEILDGRYTSISCRKDSNSAAPRWKRSKGSHASYATISRGSRPSEKFVVSFCQPSRWSLILSYRESIA